MVEAGTLCDVMCHKWSLTANSAVRVDNNAPRADDIRVVIAG